jgi:uncharacterized protein
MILRLALRSLMAFSPILVEAPIALGAAASSIQPMDRNHPSQVSRPEPTRRQQRCGTSEEFILPRPNQRIRAGVVQRPIGSLPAPVAILLPGSGYHNRDVVINGYPYFKVFSEALCRHGIASLRLDDPGMGRSNGSKDQLTIQELMEDIKASAEKIKSLAWADSRRIGLIGHSEGGLFSLMLGSQIPNANFLVLMAAPARPLGELVPQQLSDTAQEQGLGAQDSAAVKSGVITLFHGLEALPSVNDRIKILQDFVSRIDQLKNGSLLKTFWIGLLASGWNHRLISPWLYSHLKVTQAFIDHSIRVLPQHVLVLQGSSDSQVNPTKDARRIDSIMTNAKLPHKTIFFENLDHLFGVNPAGTSKGYGRDWSEYETTILPLVSNWIKQQPSGNATSAPR